MTACCVSAAVASKLLAAHGSADAAIAFHCENPDHLNLVFAPHVPLALRQRVFAYDLSVADHFTGKLLCLALGPDGLPLTPAQHLAHILRPLQLVKAAQFFFLNSSGMRRFWQQHPLRLDHRYMSAEFSSVELLRSMFGCAGIMCRRLTASPWNEGWEGLVMDRVMRGRFGKVQVRRQRRACLLCV